MKVSDCSFETPVSTRPPAFIVFCRAYDGLYANLFAATSSVCQYQIMNSKK